jgi:bifunctional DNase/RNase
MEFQSKFIQMIVAGIVVDPNTQSPIVILKDPNSETCLPIWIGQTEATSIAVALKDIEVERPLTHDLFKNTLDQTGVKLVRVSITSLKNDTFISKIELQVGEECKEIDSRPSDAIALALRYSLPINVSLDILEVAKGILVPVSEVNEKLAESELDVEVIHVENESQEKNINGYNNFNEKEWLDMFSSMDPTDFKYKI